MKKLIFTTIMLLCFAGANAQNVGKVSSYYSQKMDSLVADFAMAATSQNSELYEMDPIYYKLFTPVLLYNEPVHKGISVGFDMANKNGDATALNAAEQRSAIVSQLLFNVYRDNPASVELTEEQLREVQTTDQSVNIVSSPDEKAAVSALPENLEGELETKIVKPNYWRTSGDFSLNFSQNYVSDNWSKGGENNRTMLALLTLRFNYDDKKKISWTNTFDVKLGFATTASDTLHSLRTNNDMLRLDSKLGYKIAKNLDLSVKMSLQTQSLPNYPANSHDFVSNFMAPFDANFSLGFTYKRSGEKWNYDIFFAPLSSYNYRFVRYGDLIGRYGIDAGRHHKEDFGTNLLITGGVTIAKNLRWTTRMEFYSNYSRASFDWENTFTAKISKYFDAKLILHGIFDDRSAGLRHKDYGYWQLKEFMSFGLTYSW